MTARDTYVENMKLELDKLNDQLESLEAKATHARQEAFAQYELELTKLRAHARDARVKFEELTASGETSWHQWVSDMDHMRDAFIQSFHDAKSRL